MHDERIPLVALAVLIPVAIVYRIWKGNRPNSPIEDGLMVVVILGVLGLAGYVCWQLTHVRW
jgi:hypothetical protein